MGVDDGGNAWSRFTNKYIYRNIEASGAYRLEWFNYNKKKDCIVRNIYRFSDCLFVTAIVTTKYEMAWNFGMNQD